MSVALLTRSSAPGNWLRRFFWAHPEWWTLVLMALAWGAVVAHAGGHPAHGQYTMRMQDMLPTQDRMPVPAMLPVLGARPFQVELLLWGLMVVAMMVPRMLRPLRWVAFQSFRQRRHRAILLFLLGYLLPWMLVGAAAAGLPTLGWSNIPFLAAGIFGLAALWALAPVRRQALIFCHLTMPLAPSGWKADRDCLRFSLRVGASCVATCGLLMLACAVTGHNLIAMLGGTVLSTLELRAFRPPTFPIVAGALLLAGWFLLPISGGLLP